MRDHDERNRRSRERLAALTAGLDAAALRRPLGEHWNIATGLLHLAFWDRFVTERWAHADSNDLGLPVPFESVIEDLVNETLTPLLLRIPVEEAVGRALEAALASEQTIAGLSAEKIEAAQREGKPRLVDRSIHRTEHLDEIEALLG